MAYTFKDDGSALTYYREYNKEVGTGDQTLVGNWVEERALRDAIATGRYKLWTNPDPDPKAPQKAYTKFTPRPDSLDTYRRTVVHSDHTPSADYVTSNNVPDPGVCVYSNPEKGAREALLACEFERDKRSHPTGSNGRPSRTLVGVVLLPAACCRVGLR